MLKSSDHDNLRLDSTYIEFCIFSLLKIDLLHLIQIKAHLAKNFHIQPSEIDMMPMWEYELFLKYLNDAIKEENEKQESEMSKYKIEDYKKMSDPSRMNKSFQQPKMPTMTSIKM